MPHFDGTVTLGNVLTMVTIASGALVFFLRIDLKVKSHDKWIEDHAECNKTQVAILNELRNDISYLRGKSDGRVEQQERTWQGALQGPSRGH